MKKLNHVETALNFVNDVNDNLIEMGASVTVDVTHSAQEVVGTLNNTFEGINGVNVLNTDDNAEDFVDALNSNFERAGHGIIASFNGTAKLQTDDNTYEEEMADTITKVKNLKDSADMILVVSTDLHHEVPETYNGKTLNYGEYSNTNEKYFPDTFSPMMSNHNEFLRRAALQENGINVDAVVSLGDFFEGHRVSHDGLTAQQVVTEYVSRIMRRFRRLKDAYDIPLIFSIGNHDDNRDEMYGWTPSNNSSGYQYLHDTYLSNVEPTDANSATNGLDYYIDFDDKHIRVVVLFCEESLNTSGSWSTSDANNWTIPSKSLTYLQNCVSSLPNGYKILLMSHCHPVMSRGSQTGIVADTNVAFMNYVEENAGKFIGYLVGHAHTDWVRGYPIASFSLLCGKTHGVWNVITIDTTNKTINLVRFGGSVNNGATTGRDRISHYEPINGVGGETYNFIPTINNVVVWGVITSSWCSWGFRSNMSSTYGGIEIPSSPYYEIPSSETGKTDSTSAIDKSSFNIRIKEGYSSTTPQCITVYARNNDTVEYWTVKIPKTE